MGAWGSSSSSAFDRSFAAHHRTHHLTRWASTCRALTRVIVMNLVLGGMSQNIDNWAHMGGLAGGAALAFLCGPNLVWERGRLVDRPFLPLFR